MDSLTRTGPSGQCGRGTTEKNGYGPEPPAEHARPSGAPLPQEWKTPALWGVADSAPYFHDEIAGTLSAAILKHNGDAKPVKAAFEKLPETDRTALIQFLESLKAPPSAKSDRTAKVGR